MNNIFKKTKTLFKISLAILILSFFTSYGTNIILAQSGPGNPSFDDIVEDAEQSNPGDPNDDPLHSDQAPGPTQVPLTPQDAPAPGINPDVYDLLQPIGEVSTFKTTDDCAFVKYLDAMIKIFIGVAAVLGMIMIIAGGIQYMTSEVVSGKREGLDKLWNALLGLAIALAAWIILNTINPNLLNFCLSKQLPEARVTLEDESEAYPGDSGGQDVGLAPGGPVGDCTEGIIQVNSSGGPFFTCKNIAFSVLLMMESAWANKDRDGDPDPIKLSFWGFRTRERQIQLRIQNCGGASHENIYNKPSKSCNPPTARPGASRHEVGMAFDISCEGKTIKSRANKCFRWLATNAPKYKLYNLPEEPWHWSVDGR